MTLGTTTRAAGAAYELRPITIEDGSRWNAIVDRFESRSLFHRSAWLDYLAASRRMSIRRWQIHDGADTVGYLCGGLLEMGPFRILGSPLRSWGTNLMGPLVSHDIDQGRLIGAIERLARQERLSMIELENPVLSNAALRATGFEPVRDWTYIVKLSPEESSMWHALESVCRNRIRRAEHAGVTVEETGDSAVVDEYYDLYLRLMQRKGRRAPFPRQTVQALFSHLRQAGNIFALRARDAEGNTVAAGLFPHDDQTMYFWSGASDETAHALCPNDLLHWTAMRLAAQRGLHAYNMSGYGRFKRKFGGNLVELARWHKCYSLAARWGREAYRYWFDHWGNFAPRRRPAAVGQAKTTVGELPMPVLRQRPTFRISDIYRAPLHDFPIRDEILFQYLPVSRDKDLLEIGPGSGFTAFRLARQVGSITLSDVAEGNISQLRQALGHIPNLRFACADVCQPGLREMLGRDFDAVYAIEVFELLPDPRTCLVNLASVTRPGGHTLIQFPNYAPEVTHGLTHFATKRELGCLLQEAGFARWTIRAIRLRPLAEHIYNYMHEKPIRAYRRRRVGRVMDRALIYDDQWAFKYGQRLERFKYPLHAAWGVMSALIRAGGPAFEDWDTGDDILNHNLIVLAQR